MTVAEDVAVMAISNPQKNITVTVDEIMKFVNNKKMPYLSRKYLTNGALSFKIFFVISDILFLELII